MKLITGKIYKLKHTGQFCHAMGLMGSLDFSDGMNREDVIEATFVGEVNTKMGRRNIFYDNLNNNRAYIMFATEKIDYIIK